MAVFCTHKCKFHSGGWLCRTRCCSLAVYEYLVGSLKKTLFYFLEMDQYLAHLKGGLVTNDMERRCVMALSRLLQDDWKWEEQGQQCILAHTKVCDTM